MSFLIISIIIAKNIFYPIYIAQEVIIPYGIHPFDICSENPELWKYIKITFIICFIIANNFYSNLIYFKILSKFKFFQESKKSPKNKKNLFKHDNNSNSLNLLIGKNENNEKIYVPQSGLYQNFLITRNYWLW